VSSPPTPPRRSTLRRLPPAWTITALLALIYVIAAPASPDLAAASYRSNLFSRVGFTLWDNSWYGGHHLPAYSLLAPALGALIGPQPVAALSMTAATALFAALIAGRFPARAVWIGAAWFAVGTSVSLLSSRVPFDLGLAVGLGALLAVQRGRLWPALGLSLVCAVASPVAGAFLALAYVAWGLTNSARRWPAALALAALAPIGLLTIVFPEGGTQPFVASAFYPALAGTIVVGALMAPEQRMLRVGAALYALALIGAYVLPTAVGGNVDRLGSLAAGPIAACVLAGGSLRTRRTLALIVLAPALLYWQANAPVADFSASVSNPEVQASFYAPLVGELGKLGIGYAATPARIEVVATTDHWEARWLAPHVMLARGWERQLDRDRNALFYDESQPIAAQSYREWLVREAISYVALPDATLDYSAASEAQLLRNPPPYLHEVWRSAKWRLWAVRDPQPLAQAPAMLTQVSTDSFTLEAPRAGSYTVRIHFTPYWALAAGGGCVAEAPEEWTKIEARSAGDFRVDIDFSLDRIFSDSARCS
jgi:hypothetical protein